MNRWGVHVTDFGKIEKADVWVAPLTLFLGDNNSGKSYMMTLIYGLLKVRFFFEGFDFCEDTEEYSRCREILNKMMQIQLEETDEFYTLGKEEVRAFQNLLNCILKKGKDNFLKRLFNKKVEIGEISITFSEENMVSFLIKENWMEESPKGQITISAIDDSGTVSKYGYTIDKDNLYKDSFYRENSNNFFLSYILEYMLRKDFVMFDELGEVQYFPTARTGFLLTYKTLVGNAFQETFNQKETYGRKETYRTLLTRPNVDFLSNLSKLSTQFENIECQDIVEFIEQNLISGKINISDMPTHDMLYVPNDGTEKLPLYVTSGVVTEITPLLIMLKYGDLGTLLIEEPEISLHPGLQLEMARVMIRIVNSGMPVFATTHSDIIIQHINNMIKASELKNKEAFLEKFAYEEPDLIWRKDVALYQFDIKENQKTQVSRIQCGDYGFEAMTFFESLQQINDQIDAIEAMQDIEEA